MASTNDVAAVARIRPSGYRYVRGFGRSLSVRTRTATGERVIAAGVGLIALGVAGFLLAFLTELELAGGKPVVLMLAGGQAMIIGTMLICYQRLMEKITANANALKFEWDMGYEEGWQERDKTAKPPVLVNMDDHRCRHDHALSHI